MSKHIFAIFFLVLLILILSIVNIPTNVFLTGWDNLHPEFNVSLNIFRSVFSVWEEYQGIGSLAGMGHAANIVYQLFLIPLSFLLPVHLIRFFWTYLMLFLGPLGMYFLLLLLFTLTTSSDKEDSEEKSEGIKFLKKVRRSQVLKKFSFPSDTQQIASLLGSMFYVLNLATLQSFYTPLEVFTTHFAALPWLFYTSLRYFYTPSKKNLLFFSLTSLFFVGQGYVPTVFFVYLLGFCVFFCVMLAIHKTKHRIFSFGKLLFATFCINAFWLLPFLYFSVTASSIPVHAKINQMSTENIYWQNREFGNLTNVMLLKGFWFNTLDPSNKNPRIMFSWIQHFNNWYIWILGFLFFGIILFGVKKAFQAKSSVLFGVVALFFLCIMALTTATPPFSWVNDLIRGHFPLLSQVFRFPFTKFSILTAFTYAIFFTLGIRSLIKRFSQKIIQILLLVSCFLLLVIYMFPLFQGHLFYQKELLQIPKEYFSLFSFFQKQDPTTRIADLPQNTFWSWPFYTWGYQGSGFLWYGISQPIMDRAFDPWSSYNENYYWELTHALYSQDKTAFLDVLNKYQITWLVLDKNQYNPDIPLLYLNPNLERFLQGIPQVSKQKTLGNILIYKVTLSNKPKNFIFLTSPLPITNSTLWNDADTFFHTYGNYRTADTVVDLWYPFASLFSQHSLSFSPSQTKDSIVFKANVPEAPGILHIPSVDITNSLRYAITLHVPTDYTLASYKKNLQVLTTISKTFTATIKKITDPFLSASIAPQKTAYAITNCDTLRHGTIQITQQSASLRLTSFNANACLSILLPYLSHSTGYVVFVTAKHLEGQRIHLWIANPKEDFLPLDTYLPDSPGTNTYSFILAPMEQFTSSYFLQLENMSLANVKTVNEIGQISFYPIPYTFLKQLMFSAYVPVQKKQIAIPLNVTHPNPGIYTVTINPNAPLSSLVLSQAYDAGWKAYVVQDSPFTVSEWITEFFPFIFGSKLQNHFKVNNWENGWTLPIADSENKQKIIITYLPQYLEYSGLCICTVFVLFIGISFLRNK